MNDIVQEIINDYNSFVEELRRKKNNKVSITEEEARKAILSNLIEKRKLAKADAEAYVNKIFSKNRTIINEIRTY